MAAFTLAMSNSAMNPLIYAWKNTNFRSAFINLLKCKSPDTLEPSQSMRSNLHRKSSSAQHQDQLSSAFPNYSTPPFLQRKIEPMNAMGITFEEDEERMSTHENSAVKSTANLTNVNNSLPSVTIKIESDMRSSVVITTTTLPAVQDDVSIVSIKESSKADNREDVPSDMSTVKTGHLIVNKLMENHEFDPSDGGLKKFRENFLDTDCATTIDKSSKMKSKSVSSIAISKSTNKSNSHGSIVDYSLSKSSLQPNETANEGKTLSNKNLFPSFNFGRKNISKSFNSSSTVRVLDLEKMNGSCERVCRKSTELNFNA